MCVGQEDKEDPRRDWLTWWRTTVNNVTSTFIKQQRWLNIVLHGAASWSCLCAHLRRHGNKSSKSSSDVDRTYVSKSVVTAIRVTIDDKHLTKWRRVKNTLVEDVSWQNTKFWWGKDTYQNISARSLTFLMFGVGWAFLVDHNPNPSQWCHCCYFLC